MTTENWDKEAFIESLVGWEKFHSSHDIPKSTKMKTVSDVGGIEMKGVLLSDKCLEHPCV